MQAFAGGRWRRQTMPKLNDDLSYGFSWNEYWDILFLAGITANMPRTIRILFDFGAGIPAQLALSTLAVEYSLQLF